MIFMQVVYCCIGSAVVPGMLVYIYVFNVAFPVLLSRALVCEQCVYVCFIFFSFACVRAFVRPRMCVSMRASVCVCIHVCVCSRPHHVIISTTCSTILYLYWSTAVWEMFSTEWKSMIQHTRKNK